jgi:hypothetical protein
MDAQMKEDPMRIIAIIASWLRHRSTLTPGERVVEYLKHTRRET